MKPDRGFAEEVLSLTRFRYCAGQAYVKMGWDGFHLDFVEKNPDQIFLEELQDIYCSILNQQNRK